ncbi:MAG: MbnP family protein [Bacteroidia bacterium]
MKFYLLLLPMILSVSLYGQAEKGNVQFELVFGGQPVEIGKNYYLPSARDSIRLETIRFYISHIQFFDDDRLMGSLKKSHILLDTENPESLHFSMPEGVSGNFNRIRFLLGTDSLANVSGAMGGDLDPIQGMYWAWQSGYINIKIEGVSSVCPARNHLFQFHIGGYQPPFASSQIVDLPVSASQQIVIRADLEAFFSQVNLSETYQIMSPGGQAVKYAKLFGSVFSVTQ